MFSFLRKILKIKPEQPEIVEEDDVIEEDDISKEEWEVIFNPNRDIDYREKHTITLNQKLLHSDHIAKSKVIKIFTSSNNFFLKDERIATLERVRKFLNDETYSIRVKNDTLIEELCMKEGDVVQENDLVFRYKDISTIDINSLIKERNLEIRLETELSKITDDFEDEYQVVFSKVGGYNLPYIYLRPYNIHHDFEHLGLSFINLNGSFLALDVEIAHKDINIAKGDYLIFLFENGNKVKATFERSTIKLTDWFHNNLLLLDKELVKNLATSLLIKVKVVSNRKSKFTIFGFEINPSVSYRTMQYSKTRYGQELLQYMTILFINYHKTKNPERHDCLD
ncbi:hypothetical protein GO491_11805 [Flavobacteriaceae bacterium Ap0902]|nr:hypothetical protein [Flavobacteriaceae bacterium Ap0902]